MVGVVARVLVEPQAILDGVGCAPQILVGHVYGGGHLPDKAFTLLAALIENFNYAKVSGVGGV